MKGKLLAAAASIALISSSPASATTFDWSFTGTGNNVVGSGVIDATLVSVGEYQVTTISGTFADSPITSLLSPFTYGNDNQLFFPVAAPGLNVGLGGLGFTTAASIGWIISTKLPVPNDDVADNASQNFTLYLGLFTASPAISTTPIPPSFFLLITGFGMLGLLGWRRSGAALGA